MKKLFHVFLAVIVSIQATIIPVTAIAQTNDSQSTHLETFVDAAGDVYYIAEDGNIYDATGVAVGVVPESDQQVDTSELVTATTSSSKVTKTPSSPNLSREHIENDTKPRFWQEERKSSIAIKTIDGASISDMEVLEISQDQKEGLPEFLPKELIVKFADELDVSRQFSDPEMMDFLWWYQASVKTYFKDTNTAVLTLNASDADVLTLQQKLQADERVIFSEPNYIWEPQGLISNDEYSDNLWGLHNSGQSINGTTGTVDADIDMLDAWNYEVQNNKTIVAVLDTGVQYDHPDLTDMMWNGSQCKDQHGNYLGGCVHGYDFQNYDKDPYDDDGHGTHVAGTIAAEGNNGRGVIGVNPYAEIMALKVGSYYFSTEAIINAVNFAKHNGAKVINASFGGSEFSQATYDAIKSFNRAGGVFIAAAGNAGHDNDGSISLYPCSYDLDGVICVASTDKDDELSWFSSYGMKSVDIAAPGSEIYSTVLSGDFIFEDYQTFENVTAPETPSDMDFHGTATVKKYDDYYWGNVITFDSQSPYRKNNESAVYSKRMDLTNADYAYINFWIGCDTEYSTNAFSDYMKLEYATERGYFEHQYTYDEYMIDVNNQMPQDSNGYAYMYVEREIPAKYYHDDFQYGFTWYANDNDIAGEGCIVDDVVIRKYQKNEIGKYQYYSGTSMATPHVVGVASYMLAVNPELSVQELKDTLVNSGDYLPSLVNKIGSAKRLNAYQAIKEVATYRPASTGGGSSSRIYQQPSVPADEVVVLINNGAMQTVSQEVTVMISAGNDITHMAVSNDSDFTNVSLQEFKAIFPWTLTPGYGTKTIFVKLYNEHGHATEMVQAQIRYVKSEELERNLIQVQAGLETIKPGDLIKVDEFSAVYYYGQDLKRHVFISEKEFYSWFSAEKFTEVKVLSMEDMAQVQLGQPMLMRPGSLIKEPSQPTVYLVGTYGTLHQINSESLARYFFGENWADKVKDIGASRMLNYVVGRPIQDQRDSLPVDNAVADISQSGYVQREMQLIAAAQ